MYGEEGWRRGLGHSLLYDVCMGRRGGGGRREEGGGEGGGGGWGILFCMMYDTNID